MKALLLLGLGAVIGALAVLLTDRDEPIEALPNVESEPEDWGGWSEKIDDRVYETLERVFRKAAATPVDTTTWQWRNGDHYAATSA